MNEPQVQLEMPKYLCHKEVWALKIAHVAPRQDRSGGGIITPVEPGYAPFSVSPEYMAKHQPLSGGYFVVYKGGYQSWSPAKEFEEGYTLIA